MRKTEKCTYFGFQINFIYSFVCVCVRARAGVCVYTCMHHGLHVDVREQIEGLTLLSFYHIAFQEWRNSTVSVVTSSFTHCVILLAPSLIYSWKNVNNSLILLEITAYKKVIMHLQIRNCKHKVSTFLKYKIKNRNGFTHFFLEKVHMKI